MRGWRIRFRGGVQAGVCDGKLVREVLRRVAGGGREHPAVRAALRVRQAREGVGLGEAARRGVGSASGLRETEKIKNSEAQAGAAHALLRPERER